ncbi:hypothetical protein LguiA_010491 [Lonicera macranthoides]
MYQPHPQPHTNRSKSGRTNVASCIVAFVFLLFIIAVIIIVYFFVFKPKSPKIAVNAVQFPTFSLSNGTVNFTFFQYVTVTNPNRDTFTHYDSSLQIAYSGTPVGFAFIPAGRIDGGRSQHMSAKFAVQSFPVPPPSAAVAGVSPEISGVFPAVRSDSRMEIETRMKLVGRVRVLKVFSHRVENRVKCSVGIEASDGSVLGFHC